MNIIIKNSAADASAAVADILLRQIVQKPDSVLGLPTGGTPSSVYAKIREARGEGRGSFAFVTTFNLDEYIGLSADNPASYAHYMSENLFSHVNIDLNHTHVPCGMAADPEIEATRYESLIRAYGGIDLMLLGLGRNAHIGFNEPGSSHDSRTRRVALTPSTLEANAGYFAPGEGQPSHAITMGIGTILECRRIVLLATGVEKAEAVAASVNGPSSEDVPGSALIGHRNTTFVLDKAAARDLERSKIREIEA